MELAHWDLWLLVTALAGEAPGLDSVETLLRERLREPGGYLRHDGEAKLAQLHDLRVRLAKIGMVPEDLCAKEASDPKTVDTSRRKIFEEVASPAAYTEAMLFTPRARLLARARSGHWQDFPISPARHANDLFGIVRARERYGFEQASKLAARLHRAWKNLMRQAEPNAAELLALHRAMMTSCLEAESRTNDPRSELGDLLTAAIRRYRAVPVRETGIEPGAYLRDVIELAVWECSGQDEEFHELFKSLDDDFGSTALGIFAETESELLRHGLFEDQVEAVRANLAALLIGLGRFDDFVPLASRIGSSQLRPVVHMAEAALNADGLGLALAVFGAANRPGTYRARLAEECLRVTGQEIPRAGLRLVKSV